MKTTCLRLLAPVLLIAGTATPAFSQSATKFSGFLCQIDLSELPGLPAQSQFRRTETTTISRKTCAGVASARNAKIECEDRIAGWNLGNKSRTSLFECTLNGNVCDITPKSTDPNAPLLTATQTQLTVDSAGKAKLTCFYKP